MPLILIAVGAIVVVGTSILIVGIRRSMFRKWTQRLEQQGGLAVTPGDIPRSMVIAFNLRVLGVVLFLIGAVWYLVTLF